MNHINLEAFAGGKFSEQVNKAMEEVTQNIQNPNTDATAARKITVTITLKPNEARNFITTSMAVKTTLAPAVGIVTAMNMGKNLRTGEVEAVEVGNQIPGQMTMRLDTEKPSEGGTPNEEHEAVQHDNNVVDLRTKQA